MDLVNKVGSWILLLLSFATFCSEDIRLIV